MKARLVLILLLCNSFARAQQLNYDIVSFTPPKGWKKSSFENAIGFSTTDNKTKTWAQIGIVKSTASKGSIDADFENEWKELVVKPYQEYGVSIQPIGIDTQTFNGWKRWTGLGQFVFNNDTSSVLLNTFSNGQLCASITLMSNTTSYGVALEEFLASVTITHHGASTLKSDAVNNNVSNSTRQTSGYTFNTTNFDDGWTSFVKEDWVEVTRKNIKVLIHFPKDGTVFSADPDVLTNAAWNILVAPRYSNLRNYRTAYISDYIRPVLGMGTLTDNASGKDVFVVLYRQGSTGWLEFVADDKNTFIQEFKFDPETIQWNSETVLLKPLETMVSYNKFAIDAAEFTGTWTSDFTGVQQMYHVYTGSYAGMHMTQSYEEFAFGSNNTYNWKILLANGMVGNQNVSQAKSSGTFTVQNNWKIHFSQMQFGPKTYHAYWSCIKGARLLNLLDADAAGSGMYKVFGKK
jgi:hypothetical protein